MTIADVLKILLDKGHDVKFQLDKNGFFVMFNHNGTHSYIKLPLSLLEHVEDAEMCAMTILMTYYYRVVF